MELKSLTKIEIGSDLTIISPPQFNFRRDILLFMNFLKNNEIKRTYRDNSFPKNIASKLFRILSYGNYKKKGIPSTNNTSFYPDLISYLLKKMKLISFDTEGVYASYTSFSQSFPDNEIEIIEKNWEKYLNLSSYEKDKKILDELLTLQNEIFSYYLNLKLIRKDYAFVLSYNATSFKTIKLDEVRNSLIKILSIFKPDIWYDTKDLINYIKYNYPNLILNKDDISKNEIFRKNKYANLSENNVELTENMPDAYERVEGRYIEYFLDGIPLAMGFCSLAVDLKKTTYVNNIAPINYVKGFKISRRLHDFISKSENYNNSKIVVQPNLEVVNQFQYGFDEINYNFFSSFSKVISQDLNTLTYKLDKKVFVEHFINNNIDTTDFFKRIEKVNNGKIPDNVRMELNGWIEHSEKIILYENLCLLEINYDVDNSKVLNILKPYIFDTINKNIILIKKSDVQNIKNFLQLYGYYAHQFSYTNYKIFSVPSDDIFKKYSIILNTPLSELNKEKEIISSIQNQKEVDDSNKKNKASKIKCKVVDYTSISCPVKHHFEIISEIEYETFDYYSIDKMIFFPMKYKDTILKIIKEKGFVF